ncbi:MAG: DNA polymerase III subunit delta [Desulfobulbaceae bacterium]|uniref:DNA-directed DNA polymerase n=1 Tax=Candidatus Desulfobia pelagia TaxID=2841692 RepID=A0A8J6NEN0_9BACT|nr:DNA polymerase III subunit delta [Candidatus Desulfobia pelagia]
MPVYQRQNVSKVIKEIHNNRTSPVYLIHGERYLCQEVARDIIAALLPEEKSRALNVKKINGETENPAQTIAHLKTHSLFPGRQVLRVMDSKLFFSKAVAKNFWDKAKKAARENEEEKAGINLARVYGIGGLDKDDDLAEISASQWKKLLGFTKPQDISWAQSVKLPDSISPTQEGDGAALVAETLETTIPKNNILLLIAEAADKRKKIYKLIDQLGVIIDLSVDSGATQATRKSSSDAAITDLILKTMKEFGKKPGPSVIKLLLDRVGFHPVAAVRETEKLALYCGEKETITAADVDAIVSWTREDAIYELNEAVATRNIEQALVLSAKLRENGLHPLALVASLRNLIRKLLFFRSMQYQEKPPYPRGQSFGVFQKGYLAQLKKSRHESSPFLSVHPFVIYKTFQQAERFEIKILRKGLRELLLVEYSLKGGGINDALALDNFFFSFLGGHGQH